MTQPIEYEPPDPNPPPPGALVGAIAAGVTFCAGAWWLLLADRYSYLPPRILASWSAFGVLTLGLYLWSRQAARSRRSWSRRGSWAALVLLSTGLLVGLFGVARRELQGSGHPRVSMSDVCQGNLRRLGIAMLLYTGEHGGQLPTRIEDLVRFHGSELSPEWLVCPTTGDTPSSGKTPEQTIDHLQAGGHLSYVYVGNHLYPASAPQGVLAYEPVGRHWSGGIYVLKADYSVEFYDAVRAKRLMRELEAGFNPPRPERLEPVSTTTASPAGQEN